LIAGLVFQFSSIVHINAQVAAVQVDDDSNGNGGFSGSNGDDENGEEDTIEFARPYVFVEGDEIDIDAVQDELDTHENGDHVAAGKQAVHADEKQRCAQQQYMGNGNIHYLRFVVFLFVVYCSSVMIDVFSVRLCCVYSFIIHHS
jgi:hypothetical protein